MVRYFYAWTPLVIVTTVVLLSAPWLGLIALMILSLVALMAYHLAFARAQRHRRNAQQGGGEGDGEARGHGEREDGEHDPFRHGARGYRGTSTS